ncbi:MAG TPA: cardiolipin synthase [Tepidisphaeraceae bacterium]|nr:cardiolipin synthase [Tepidisphaeraceae bacterium]
MTWPLFWTLYQISEWVIRVVMLVYVPQRRSPAAARAWLLLILLIPWLGLVLYVLIGRPYLPRRRKVMHARISRVIREEQALRRGVVTVAPERHETRGERRLRAEFTADPQAATATLDPPETPFDLPPGFELPTEFSTTVALAQGLGDFEIMGGNAIELLDDYDGAIARLVADIDAAEHHVHLLYYIFADDAVGRRIVDALVRARRRGVSCRLLIDDAGSRKFVGTIERDLRATGAEVVRVLPVSLWRRISSARVDLRNHRKLAVIDGAIGYTGSQNVIDPAFKMPLVYEDVVVRAAGPVVAQLQAVFLADHFVETARGIRDAGMFPATPAAGASPAQLLPSGPGYPHQNLQRMIVSLMHAARHRVVITTPYFIPDEPVLQAVQTAVLRGVEVHLVVSKQIDQVLVGLAQRSYYEDLLEAGVRVHSYTRRFLHAKHVSVDDDVALIGSSNMDIRSFVLNAEVMLVVYDRAVVARLRGIQERYFADSEEITAEEWRARPGWHKVLQNVARLADSLL